MRRCSNCGAETEEGRIVWVNYEKQTNIKYLCKHCTETLKQDKSIKSFEVKE